MVHILVCCAILLQWIVFRACIVSDLDGKGEEFTRPIWSLFGCTFEEGDSLMKANKTMFAACLLAALLRIGVDIYLDLQR